MQRSPSRSATHCNTIILKVSIMMNKEWTCWSVQCGCTVQYHWWINSQYIKPNVYLHLFKGHFLHVWHISYVSVWDAPPCNLPCRSLLQTQTKGILVNLPSDVMTNYIPVTQMKQKRHISWHMTHGSLLAYSLIQTPDPHSICLLCVNKQVNVITAIRRSEIRFQGRSTRILKFWS